MATDGGMNTTTTTKGKMTKVQLLEFFEEVGYTANDLKTAFQRASVTAKMLTELHAAWARITKHPSTRDFEEASWPDICQEFERRFSHGLPNVAPASRVH